MTPAFGHSAIANTGFDRSSPLIAHLTNRGVPQPAMTKRPMIARALRRKAMEKATEQDRQTERTKEIRNYINERSEAQGLIVCGRHARQECTD